MSAVSNILQRTPVRLVGIMLALLLAFGLGVQMGGPAPEAAHPTEAERWICSMHPQQERGEPGSCPICGMDLVRATQEQGDVNTVVLSERAQALARLQTTAVVRQQDSRAELHLLGQLEYDETTRRNVTAWTGGRIDRLHVNTTGEQVRRGAVIATLYSPEVYSAHQDLITAQAQVLRLEDGPGSASQAAQAALEAAQERLRLLGLSAAEIAAMASEDTPRRAVRIRSPFAGTVVERLATEGAYIETGAPLYRIADPGSLWALLDAYEVDLPRLAVGQAVSLTVESLGSRVFEGTVAFIEPAVDRSRRTAQVRVQIDSHDGLLRPGMFAEAVVSVDSAGDVPLVIPTTAPLFTGRRSIVYVEQEPGHYTPRTVRLGPRLGEVYPVVSGLAEGERVVSRGAFALDADLQIQGGTSMMAAAEPDDAALDELVVLDAAQRAGLQPVMAAYLDLQVALAADDPPQAQAAAQALVAAVEAVTLAGDVQEAWADVATRMQRHAREVADASTLEEARAGFEPLSQATEQLLRRFGNPMDEDLRVAFCPMAMGSAGARWVQQGDVIDNAYFGASMRRCGEFSAVVSPGTYLPAPTDGAGSSAHRHAH